GRHDPASRRPDRHRHPGRGRHRLRPAPVPERRGRRRGDDHRAGDAAQPRRTRKGVNVEVNGRTLAVEDEGHGPAVLMVHGLGGTSNFYQVQADALSRGFRTIRVDSAGAGRSPVADGISIESHADDLAAVLDRLDVRSAAVVGHSMGTLVARTLAARHPGKVSALALLGAVRVPDEAARQAQRDRAAVLRERGTAAVAPGVVAGALSEEARRDRPEVAAFVRELVMRQDAEGYARNCEALAAATDPGPIDPALP